MTLGHLIIAIGITSLLKNVEARPDVLFLDVNMPRKNGRECLIEIKANEKTKAFPVIIYSTSLDDVIADVLYEKGAHYYLRKCDFPELLKNLHDVLIVLTKTKYKRPSRDKFVFNEKKVKS